MRPLLDLLASMISGQRRLAQQQRALHRVTARQLSLILERLDSMATQEDVTALEQSLGTSFDQLTTTLAGVSGDVATLKTMLEEAQGGGQQLDLTEATRLAGNIASVTQAFADLDAQTPGVDPGAGTDIPADSSGDSDF